MQLEEIVGAAVMEDGRTEFKAQLDRENIVGWLKTVAGFANAAGGTLYIGVEDRTHKLIGFDRTAADKERNYFNNKVNEHIVPRPPLCIEFLSYPARDTQRFVLRVSVAVSPVRPVLLKYKGMPAIYMRREGFTNGATYEEIRAMSLASADTPFDTLPTDQPYRREDFGELLSFFAAHNEGQELSDKALRSLGFFDADGMLASGAALFADAYEGRKTAMTCSVFSGLTRGSERIVAVNHFQGNLTRAIGYACEFVAQRMNHGILKCADGRIDLPAYPPRAILEGVVNAIAHRDYYLDGTQIQIDMFRDRLEISSPGSFYQGAPIKKTYDLSSIISKRRNALICGVLVRCKVMEAAGTGFDKIAEEYAKKDLAHKPYIFSASDHFTLVLPDLTYAAGVASQEETLEYAPIQHGTQHDRAVLSYCLTAAHTAAEIAAYLGVSNSSYLRQKILGNLVAQGYLRAQKHGRRQIYLTDRAHVRRN